MSGFPEPPVITTQSLTVRYRAFTALNNFTVSIPPGCTGLLGPNGAGKTTLIKTLLGFIKPSEGSATVVGMSISDQTIAVRRLIGLMPEQECHLPGMTGIQYAAYAGTLAGMPENQALRRAHEVLEYCGLQEARYRLVETFSTGMKQRAKLAQALVHGPKLLLLDEPTNGLDPRGRMEMLSTIRKITQEGIVNVVVSSHLMKDIERTCDHIVVVAGGTLRASGSVRELLSIENQPIAVELSDPSPAFANQMAISGSKLLEVKGSKYYFQIGVPANDLGHLIFDSAKKSGAEVRGFEIAARSLEEAFMEAIQ